MAWRRWWKITLPLGLVVGALAGAIAWYFIEPIYRASAFIKIDGSQAYIAFPQTAHANPAIFIQNERELIRSPLVMSLVVSNPEIATMAEVRSEPAPIEWLSERIQVQNLGQSELCEIAFYSSNPQLASLVVNAVVDSYFKLRNDDVTARNLRILELLDAERERRSHEINSIRNRVRELTKQASANGQLHESLLGGEAVDAALVLRAPLATMQQRLVDAEVERELADAQLKAFREFVGQREIKVPHEAVKRAVSDHPSIKRLEETLAAKKARLAGIRAVLRPEQEAFVQHLHKDLASTEQELERMRGDLHPEVAKSMQASLMQEWTDRVANLEADVDGRRMMTEILKKRLDEQRRELESTGSQSLDLEFARSDLERAQDILEKISDRSESLRTEMRAPPRVSRLRAADVPQQPRRDSRLKKVAAAGAGGLLLPFALSFLWELRFGSRVTKRTHLAEEVSLSVLGEVTTLPAQPLAGPSRLSVRFERQWRHFEESIDNLRTKLLLLPQVEHAQVFVVTSAVSREGKTRLATHLAMSFARMSPGSTLLIDADMRDPDVHTLFDIPLEPGLTDVLEGHSTVAQAIVPDACRGLHVLPAGVLARNPHDLVLGDSVGSLLRQLRDTYRYIIVDVAPVLPAAETLMIARAADATLIATRRNVSRGETVRLACQQLDDAGARVIGAVLSGVPANSYGYRYGNSRYVGGYERVDDVPEDPLPEGQGEAPG